MRVTIAMGAFNEAPNLERVVVDALRALSASGEDGEVLVVDDGSIDGTSAIADRLAGANRNVRVVHHPSNRGFSGAMTTALRSARGDWIFLGPADGQFLWTDLPRFLAASAHADVVVGIREHRPERVGRRVLSRAFHLIAKALFPLPLKEFSSLFLFRRALVEAMPIRSRPRTATLLPEVLFRARMRGARFATVVIEMRPRIAGEAKGGRPLNALATLVELFRLAPLVRWDERRGANRVAHLPSIDGR